MDRSELVLASIVCVLAIALAWVFYEQTQTTRQICEGQNRQNALIVQQLQRGEKNLPRLVYYQHHPRELASQLAQIHEEERAFGPQSCP